MSTMVVPSLLLSTFRDSRFGKALSVLSISRIPFKLPLKLKLKAKASDSYTARLTGTKPDQPRFTIIGSGS